MQAPGGIQAPTAVGMQAPAACMHAPGMQAATATGMQAPADFMQAPGMQAPSADATLR